jgi:hypothetical protein
LATQINGVSVTGLVAAALGKRARALGQLGGDGGVLRNPVGEGILAVLNDAVVCQYLLRENEFRVTYALLAS